MQVSGLARATSGELGRKSGPGLPRRSINNSPCPAFPVDSLPSFISAASFLTPPVFPIPPDP